MPRHEAARLRAQAAENIQTLLSYVTDRLDVAVWVEIFRVPLGREPSPSLAASSPRYLTIRWEQRTINGSADAGLQSQLQATKLNRYIYGMQFIGYYPISEAFGKEIT
ncbi:hypothetical protein D8B26_002537 [Coccidioides posadasii str. Silveira]|uniref:uncharacterized protein n=1 Tax=Coccidioides posadasii (strain RMSCC 757 / Silveira) TaxID=443226 RepID=UPI001BEE0FAC|nr:hypothetical protein D8B26_002537 [Coccidioides posadasii str. Silveira]